MGTSILLMFEIMLAIEKQAPGTLVNGQSTFVEAGDWLVSFCLCCRDGIDAILHKDGLTMAALTTGMGVRQGRR